MKSSIRVILPLKKDYVFKLIWDNTLSTKIFNKF